jgi:hypothetical protein
MMQDTPRHHTWRVCRGTYAPDTMFLGEYWEYAGVYVEIYQVKTSFARTHTWIQIDTLQHRTCYEKSYYSLACSPYKLWAILIPPIECHIGGQYDEIIGLGTKSPFSIHAQRELGDSSLQYHGMLRSMYVYAVSKLGLRPGFWQKGCKSKTPWRVGMWHLDSSMIITACLCVFLASYMSIYTIGRGAVGCQLCIASLEREKARFYMPILYTHPCIVQFSWRHIVREEVPQVVVGRV